VFTAFEGAVAAVVADTAGLLAAVITHGGGIAVLASGWVSVL
jgi:hypothetical protein